MVIYLLQKLWKTYYYASSLGLSEFTVRNVEKKDVAYYEMLVLDCFSTECLKIYLEGSAKTRLQKTKLVVKYPPATKYLNVCWLGTSNCSRCTKCCRTLVALDILGQLDEFSSVFDIDYYKANRWKYYIRLYGEHLIGDPYVKDLYSQVSHKINMFHRIGGFVRFLGHSSYEIFQHQLCNRIPALSQWYNKKSQEFLDRKAGVDQ